MGYGEKSGERKRREKKHDFWWQERRKRTKNEYPLVDTLTVIKVDAK